MFPVPRVVRRQTAARRTGSDLSPSSRPREGFVYPGDVLCILGTPNPACQGVGRPAGGFRRPVCATRCQHDRRPLFGRIGGAHLPDRRGAACCSRSVHPRIRPGNTDWSGKASAPLPKVCPVGFNRLPSISRGGPSPRPNGGKPDGGQSSADKPERFLLVVRHSAVAPGAGRRRPATGRPPNG
jgi:hypothetical protein